MRSLEFLDAHVHSTFSDGDLTVAEIVRIAEAKGVRVGIADHVGSTYPLSDEEEIVRYLDFLSDFPVYRAMELNINERFPLSEAVLSRTDYRVGGAHFYGPALVGIEQPTIETPVRFVDRVVELIVAALEERRMDILSHPTCLPRALACRETELFTRVLSEKIIDSAIKNHVALECSNLFKVPNSDFVRLALARGAMFSLGSDGHKEEAMCELGYGLAMVEQAGIPRERLFSGPPP